MRKLEITNAKMVQLAIQQEIMKNEESRYNHRLHGLLLICKGFSCYEVADIMGHSPRSVEYWVQHFEQNGFAGLSDRPRPGRPPAHAETLQQVVERDLRTDPRELGYTQTMWDGKLFSHHLLSAYGGSRTNVISSSMDHDTACGYLRKSKTLWCFMHLHARNRGYSVRYKFVKEDW